MGFKRFLIFFKFLWEFQSQAGSFTFICFVVSFLFSYF